VFRFGWLYAERKEEFRKLCCQRRSICLAGPTSPSIG
jgi:hypothetical protein